jgi:hypothetical protein
MVNLLRKVILNAKTPGELDYEMNTALREA